MRDSSPHIVIIAGPNGAGKSTVAPSLLQGGLRVKEFVNADLIARGISAFQPDVAAIGAGRVMLERVRSLAAKRVDFSFETTLASRSFAPWIRNLVSRDYSFTLLFLWIPSVEVALTRVRERVLAGGHSVPDETVRRRYAAGLHNFFHLYREHAARWHFYDNGSPEGPQLLAVGRGSAEVRVSNPRLWNEIKVKYGHE